MGVNNMKNIIAIIFTLFTIDYMKFYEKIMNEKDDVEYVTPKIHSIDIDV